MSEPTDAFTAPLEEKQFELDGVQFGLDLPVAVTGDGWSPGSRTLRSQDEDEPTGDGVRFGRDHTGSETWSFGLYTDAPNEAAGYASAAELKRAWAADWARLTPGQPSVLRYHLAGKTRRVYGRSGRWTPTVGPMSMGGRIDIQADFRTRDDVVYDDTLQSHEIPIAPPVAADAGVELPLIPPFTISSGSVARQTTIVIGGEVDTPLIITMHGPLVGGMVETDYWRAVLLDSVAEDDPVTIDARPWIKSATKESGGGVRISPRLTRISKLWLPPGSHSITFTGEDPTASASAVISWRNAFQSPR